MTSVIRSDNSITVVLGSMPYAVSKDDERYAALTEALDAGDDEKVAAIVGASQAAADVIATFGQVEVFNGHIKLNGKPCHNYVAGKIVEAQQLGYSIEPLANFLDRLYQNPSFRVVNDLYKWCEASKMPLLDDGRIVAFKYVRSDFKDCHTGTMDNSPGKIVEMPRNAVDEDPRQTCSAGLHFCGPTYLPNYGTGSSDGKRLLLLAVDPADVVAFPTDYHLQKARCCRYEVIQEIPWDDRHEVIKGGPFVPNWGYVVPPPAEYVVMTPHGLFVSDPEDQLDLAKASYFTEEAAGEVVEDGDVVLHKDEAQAAQDAIVHPAEFYVQDADNTFVDCDCQYTDAQPAPMTEAKAKDVASQMNAHCRVVHEDDVVQPTADYDVEDEDEASSEPRFYVLDRDEDFIDSDGDYIDERCAREDRPSHTRAEAELIVENYCGLSGPVRIVSVTDFDAGNADA